MRLLQGADHGGVGEGGVTTQGDALWQGGITAGSTELFGYAKRNGCKLGGMDRLAQAGFSRERQTRQPPEQLKKLAEIAVAVRACLAVDEGGLKDGARYLQKKADGVQAFFR